MGLKQCRWRALISKKMWMARCTRNTCGAMRLMPLAPGWPMPLPSTSGVRPFEELRVVALWKGFLHTPSPPMRGMWRWNVLPRLPLLTGEKRSFQTSGSFHSSIAREPIMRPFSERSRAINPRSMILRKPMPMPNFQARSNTCWPLQGLPTTSRPWWETRLAVLCPVPNVRSFWTTGSVTMFC